MKRKTFGLVVLLALVIIMPAAVFADDSVNQEVYPVAYLEALSDTELLEMFAPFARIVDMINQRYSTEFWHLLHFDVSTPDGRAGMIRILEETTLAEYEAALREQIALHAAIELRSRELIYTGQALLQDLDEMLAASEQVAQYVDMLISIEELAASYEASTGRQNTMSVLQYEAVTALLETAVLQYEAAAARFESAQLRNETAITALNNFMASIMPELEAVIQPFNQTRFIAQPRRIYNGRGWFTLHSVQSWTPSWMEWIYVSYTGRIDAPPYRAGTGILHVVYFQSFARQTPLQSAHLHIIVTGWLHFYIPGPGHWHGGGLVPNSPHREPNPVNQDLHFFTWES